MIRIDDVYHSYGNTEVLHDINLSIGEGELLGIIGKSGAGKTTLLRLLLGEIAPTYGSIRAHDGNLPAAGYVPQVESGEREFPLTVEGMVLLGTAAFSDRRPWFDRREKSRAHRVLERLGIDDLAHRRLNELSGGQFQRALIARALMSRPTLLLLDEPTSGIDMDARRTVLSLLEQLAKEGLTVVLTTHDLNWVASHLPRIVCLNRTIIADGTPQTVLTAETVSETFGADMDVLMHDGRPVVVDKV
jgi:ABC-type Mn2+/Zn2+ transport system ATPase subunit